MFSNTYFPPDYFESRYFVNAYTNIKSLYADEIDISVNLNRAVDLDLGMQTQLELVLSINRQVDDVLNVNRKLEFTVER